MIPLQPPGPARDVEVELPIDDAVDRGLGVPRPAALAGNVWELTSFQFFPEKVMTSVLEPCGTPFRVLAEPIVARPDRASADRDALATWRTMAAVSSTGPRARAPGADPVSPALATSTATATAAAAAVSPVPASTAACGTRRAGRG